MASTHKHIRSSTADKRPTTSIADGQIALNTNLASPGLFFKDSTGATIIKIGPVHVGTTAPNATPAAGGSSGNSTGEIWLDTSLTPVGVKIWNAGAWTNATPIGSTTVQGLLELATDAETQAGADTARAVTPAGLQSKVSDSTSTTSSTTIASSTAVKSAYDLANAALPKSGGTVTGNLEIGTTGSLTFEGSTADGFETALAVVDPTADNTITLPNVSGTVITTGDTGTVTSTMIADGTIVNGDINASAAIAGTKISPDFGSQTIQTTGIVSHALGSAGAPTLTFTGDTNTGIYSPGADQVAISTNGTGRLFVDSTGRVGIGTSSISTISERVLHIYAGTGASSGLRLTGNAGTGLDLIHGTDGSGYLYQRDNAFLAIGTNNLERLRITSTGALNFVGAGTAGSTQAVSFNGSAPVNSLVIDSTGKVGVGTSSPSYRLHVEDNSTGIQQRISSSSTSGTTLSFVNTAANGRNYRIGSNFITGNGEFALYDDTASASRIFVNSSGSVGVGTTSPGAELQVNGNIRTSGAAGTGYELNDANTKISIPAANSIAFTTSAFERVRIDNSGRLLVGTSTARSNYYSSVTPSGLQSETGSLAVFQNSNNTTGSALYVGKSRGTTANSNTVVQANDQLGAVVFFGADGTNVWPGAQITASVDGTPGANDMPGRLVFSTTADGASSPTERLRIDSSGRLLVGTSSSLDANTPFQIAGAANGAAVFRFSGTASDEANITLYRSKSSTVGTNASLANGDAVGGLFFSGANGSSYNRAASIVCEIDGAVSGGGANDMPGRLVFSTTADGASSPTERLRIDSSGYLTALGVYNDTSVAAANVVVTVNGNIRRSTSSIKYKTNVETLEDSYADAILNCRPVWYQSTCPGDNPDYGHWGFIAEEVAEIDPRLCSFKEQEDGTLDPEGVQYDRFVPHLLNLIKRQGETIAALEARLAALENA